MSNQMKVCNILRACISYSEPFVVECIEPVLAASYYRAPVDLLGRSVYLRKRFGSSEDLLEELVGIGHEQHKKSSADEDDQKHYKYRNENGGYSRTIIRQLFPPGCPSRSSGADSLLQLPGSRPRS